MTRQDGGDEDVFVGAPKKTLNMCDLPDSVQLFLAELDGIVFWSLQKRNNVFSLTVKWQNKQEQIRKESPSNSAPVCHVTSVGEAMTPKPPKSKKRKSPSTIRRDQLRLQAWKDRRSKIATPNVVDSPSDSISAEPVSRDGPTIQQTVEEPVSSEDSTDSPQSPPLDTDQQPHDSVADIPSDPLSTTEEDTLTSESDPDDLDDTGTGLLCYTCCRPETSTLKLKSCTGCRLVEYCSKECQIKDWNGLHKQQCASLAKIKGNAQ